MSIKPDDLKKKGDRSIKQIVQEILTLPLEKGASDPVHTTFASCLRDSMDTEGGDYDASSQLEDYGIMNFTQRAQALLELLELIVTSKTEFTREEIETLKDALVVTAGACKMRRNIYSRSLESTRNPAESIFHAIGKDDDSVRSMESEAYYGQKFIYDSLENKIPPLFQELATKMMITLDPPEIM